MPTRRHTAYAPHKANREAWFEIEELTHLQCREIAEEAAKKCPTSFLESQILSDAQRRLKSIRGFRRFRAVPDGEPECTLRMSVDGADGCTHAEIIATLTEREAGFLALLVDRVHEVRQEESALFFAGIQTTEV